MDKFVIEGGALLEGAVSVSGAKNAALPMMAASILTDEDVVIRNVPDLMDVRTMIQLLEGIGAKVIFEKGIIRINASSINSSFAPYDIVRKMRASICLLGPLAARMNEAEISMPGGCVIGPRPVDLHIKGLRALGMDVKIEHGYIKAKGIPKGGRTVFMGGRFGPSVTATANMIMASVYSDGDVYIENAAQEPEIQALSSMLVAMGAEIEGVGAHTVKIKGVKKLHGCDVEVIPDRIEAGTFIILGAAAGRKVLVEGIQPRHLGSLFDKLQQCGIEVKIGENSAEVRKPKNLKSIDVTTHPYPGFPTDLQAQMMALLTVSDGISLITEKVYPERFIHISELNRMGADIRLEGPTAIIRGVEMLSGASVMASDLRASAGLVIAGLMAEGETTVYRVYHIDRGYEKIELKLQQLGANIKRVKE